MTYKEDLKGSKKEKNNLQVFQLKRKKKRKKVVNLAQRVENMMKKKKRKVHRVRLNFRILMLEKMILIIGIKELRLIRKFLNKKKEKLENMLMDYQVK